MRPARHGRKGQGGGIFQSTHPVRGATVYIGETVCAEVISIHAPRAGCDYVFGVVCKPDDISIHAPRAGCDSTAAPRDSATNHFNPRTPCGVRLIARKTTMCRRLFQSTHPVRGATTSVPTVFQRQQISIHAPRAGCDVFILRCCTSRRGISIHAPRAGCDASVLRKNSVRLFDFNPRTPCGVRLKMPPGVKWDQKFQSTHPVRGATRRNSMYLCEPRNFNPRTPCGVRRT